MSALLHVDSAVVALADGLAVALADDCGNGVGSYPDHVQAASAATANAAVAATSRGIFRGNPFRSDQLDGCGL